MMAMDLAIFVGLVILVLNIDTTSSEPVVCSNNTRNLERGEQAVVSCEYAMDFIAVFWYKGDEETPFLRLEGGKNTTEEGFSIDSSGYMIIQNVQIDNEGSYRISVLDSNGATTSATVDIYVKVSLKSNPQLERCSTSQHELCQTIDESQRAGFLICYTTETRPAVNFRWSKLSSNLPANVDELRSTSSMNSSTGLFSSSSVLSVSLNTFSLQYFTCSALGVAVMDERVTEEFIEGNNEDVPEHLGVERVINQGEPLKISCSSESFQLRIWKFTHPDSPARIVKEFYPGQKGGPCLFGSECSVDDKGVLSIEDTSYEDEGIYECTYGNGDIAEKLTTQVSIIIKPNPERIVIQGCADINDCRKNVALTGKLEVYVTGARPPVELKCEVTEEENSHGFIFGDINNKTPNTDSGTFDTHYTANYEIDECRGPVHVVCKIQGDAILSNLHPSHVYLVTDDSNCRKRRPGLIVFLVLLFVLLAIAIIVIVLYKKRPTVQKYLRRWLEHEHRSETETEAAPKGVSQKEDEERGQGEGAYMENEIKSVEESSQPLLTNEETSLYDEFCKRLKETKGVCKELFENLMEMFQGNDQKKSPSSLLLDRLVKDNLDDELLFKVIQYLAESPFKEWVQVVHLCKWIEDLTLSNKLSSGRSITIYVTLFKGNKINLTTYVEQTGKMLNSGQFDDVTIMNNLKDLLSKTKITQEELVDSTLQYVNSFKMSETKALEEVRALEEGENRVSYLLFLQGIYQMYKLGSCRDVLFNLFDEIVEKFLSPKSLKVVQQRVSDKNEVILSVYLQVLLCSSFDGKLPLEMATSILRKNKESLLHDFVEEYDKCMQNDKISQELKCELPPAFLQLLEKVASPDDYEEKLLQVITSKQVAADKFEETLLKMISNKKHDQTFWIKFVVDLWMEDKMKKDLKSKLIVQIAETHLMKREDFKAPIDKLVLSVDDRRKFMESIKFDDVKIKKEKERQKKNEVNEKKQRRL